METEGLHASSSGSFGILYFDNHHGETWTSLCWLRSKFGSSSKPQHPCGQKLKTSISYFLIICVHSVTHYKPEQHLCCAVYDYPSWGRCLSKTQWNRETLQPKMCICWFYSFTPGCRNRLSIYEITNFSCDTNKGDQDGSYRQTFCNCCFVMSNDGEGYYLYFQLQLVFVTFFSSLSLFENKTLAMLGGGIFCWQKNN